MQHALPDWQKMDLERPADLGLLTTDLEGYLSANPKSVVFDEAQRLPELFRVSTGTRPALGLNLPARRLRRLWEMLTHVHGSLLNVSDLARSLTVSSHTVTRDLDVLEGALMIRRLQPFHANVQKRLTKSPKLYVRDTGLLHFLAGLREARELDSWPKRGHSFEGLVIEQLVALAERQSVRPEFFFWRTQAGAEVDLLIKAGRRLIPVEIKLGSTVGLHDVMGLRSCMKDLGLKRGLVVSSTTERRRLSPSIEIIPWDGIAAGKFEL